MPIHKPGAKAKPRKVKLPVIPLPPLAGTYKQHRDNWRGCVRCTLHEGRKHVVLARGKLPCDILFVGEAPGKSEDCSRTNTPGIGKPFVGPAGHLLNTMMFETIGSLDPDTTEADWDDQPRYSFALTNLAACVPVDPDSGLKEGQPPPAAIKACAPRLTEFWRLARPRLVVCVGNLPAIWLDKKRDPSVWTVANWRPKPFPPMVQIKHPAYMLRQNLAIKRAMMDEAMVEISQAIDKYLSK